MPLDIRPYLPGDHDAVVALVLAIQRDEFGIPITAEEQPDLLDIPRHYQQGLGNFWVALDREEIVGTIGLLDIGPGDAALRKMFVAPSHRGAPHRAGSALLATCLDWSRQHHLTRVILGTTEQFQAAHRFYEKAGFRPILPGNLPAHFPRMRLDTRFYWISPQEESGAAPTDQADGAAL